MDRRRVKTLIGGAAIGLASLGAMRAAQDNGARSLEETRLSMNKWIETQQLLSKERKDWQQGREILAARLDVVKQEIATLEEKIAQAQTAVTAADAKRAELIAENDRLKAAGAQLAEAAGRLEAEVRRLFPKLPDPVRTRLQPLTQRMPEDPANTKVSAAERFQNVLGILNELNKANGEISVAYEVHELAGGKPTEVKTLYVGLAQAWYVSGGGEAGIGRPPAEGGEGWKWEPANAIAGAVTTAVEVLEGKQSPAFVPLPVQIR